MYCLFKGNKIESDNWNRQPVCDCANCQEYFRLRRVDFYTNHETHFAKEFAEREINNVHQIRVKQSNCNHEWLTTKDLSDGSVYKICKKCGKITE